MLHNKWLRPRALLTRWSPLCCAAYGVWLYRRGINEDLTSVEVHCYTHLPLRIVSKAWGAFADLQMPRPLRPYVYGPYARAFRVDLDEAADPDLANYPTLGAFFVRALRAGARPLDVDCALACPCDGKILHCGPVTDNKIEQIKGVTYSLEDFLGENSWSSNTTTCDNYYKSLLSNESNCLHQCVIYLAPGDYHRFHSPCDWSPSFRRHFSGKLLSVQPLFAKLIPGLFCVNERVVYAGRWRHGFFSYTPVGATNVGSIRVYKDEALKTNGRKLRRCRELRLLDVAYERGELAGQFQMGSTIVLIFEAPKDFKFAKSGGDSVRMGEKLGDIVLEH